MSRKSTLSDFLIIWDDVTKEISDYREILTETACIAADCSLCSETDCRKDYYESIIAAKTAYRDKLETAINDILESGEYTISDVIQWIDCSFYVSNDTPISYLWDYDSIPENWKSETCYYLTTSGENIPTLETCNDEW